MAARLRPLLVLALGCLALLPAPALAQAVGVTAAVNQTAIGTPPAAKPRTMVLGDQVIHNEKIETNGKGLLQILLVDGTSFTVGPNSSMAIDSFVYDPGAGTARVVATLGKGVFRFIGGKTSKSPDGATINTPVGTVGIRGGIGDFDFSGQSGIPFHIDMLFGNSMTLTDHGTTIGRLFRSGYSLAIGPGGKVIVQKTPASWTQALQQAMAGHGGTAGSSHGNNKATRTALAKALGGPLPATLHIPRGVALPDTGPADTPPLPPLPLLPFNPPELTSGTATWAEIDNSSLAGAGALYTGDASAIFNITPNEGNPSSTDWNGRFLLGYYFAQQDGGGFFALRDTDNDEPGAVVPIDAIRASGPAIFSGETTDGDEQSWLQTGVRGQFFNTPAGIAHGVGGTISISGQNVDTQLPGGDLVNGDVTATGAFGGTLQGTSQAPP